MSCEQLLSIIKERYSKILHENLVGIYIHGSIALGCFNWNKSDIDFIVVVNEQPTQAQKVSLIEVLLDLNSSAPLKGFEMSVVLKANCQQFVYPTPFELHYSNTHYLKCIQDLQQYCFTMNGVDYDLAAHFTIIKQAGIVLCGSETDTVFGEIPKELYLDSIRSDVIECKEEILNNPVYIILNLCRVLAYVKDNLVLSKLQGGQWGIEKLESIYHPLINDAIHCYCSDEDMKPNEDVAQHFCDDMMSNIFQ